MADAYMIEVTCNDRLGKKIRVKCKCVARRCTRSEHRAPSRVSPPARSTDDTVGDLKKLIAAQIGTRPEKIRLQKWYTIFKDHITLADYEIHDGMGLELFYN